MFEYQLVIPINRKKIISKIYEDLELISKEFPIITTSYDTEKNKNIIIACDDFEKARMCFFISDIVSNVISLFYKTEFIENNLLLPIKNEVGYIAFKKALVAFDRETDKYIISKALKINKILNLESFYNFRLKQLRIKWLELIKLANDNAGYLLCNDTFIDLLKFLIENIEISVGVVNVLKENNNFVICDEYFNKINKKQIDIQEIDEQNLNNDVNLITSLIALSPKKINIHCDKYENSQALTLLSQIFENRITIMPVEF